MLLDGLKHVVTERRGMDEKIPLLTALVVIRIVSVDTHRRQALSRHPDAGRQGWILSATLSASSLHPKMAGGGLFYSGVQ
jgi:hypothetical protein